MSDLVARLRDSVRAARALDRSELLAEAADEIVRLRGYRDEAEAETAVARLLVDRLRLTDAEREAADCTLTPLALTDAERDAVAWALKEAVWSYSADTGNHRPTLRGLLERLGGAQ